jgi:hypothetical protein
MARLNELQFSGALEQLVVTKHIEVKGPDASEGRLYVTLFPSQKLDGDTFVLRCTGRIRRDRGRCRPSPERNLSG